MQVNTIICGAMPEATKGIPDGSFNCSISSPPYWSLRDYGVDGQLGLEPTFEEYIDKLCTIYDEVKRVLRKDGTCFVNLGDTFWGGGNNRGNNSPISDKQASNKGAVGQVQVAWDKSYPTKSLCLIPQRFAIEMVNRGWILRNVIIWHKPNPMPSSAKDRFTVDFEYVYFFVKSKKYWFEPQYEPQSPNCHSKGTKLHPPIEDAGIGHKDWHKYTAETWLPLGRNKRTVWTIPTQPFPEAHFATFPEKLVEPMIKAGCPEFVCTKCGKAREKIYDTVFVKKSDSTSRAIELEKQGDRSVGLVSRQSTGNNEHYFKGYTDCGCNADWRPGIMLEPFCGSGTALQVAARLRRNWIGVELKPEYIEMAEKRATQGETGLSVKEQNQGQQPLFPA